MRLAVYGGTFNPPHLGHLSAARACVEKLALDRLWLVPANIPPHKQMPEGSASPEQRLAMCRIAAGHIPNCAVCAWELEQKGVSYTVNTLEELRRLHPQDELWLVMGTDMLLTFESWKSPERIAQLCRFAVVARDEHDRKAIAEQAEHLSRTIGAQIDIVDTPALPVSSTQARQTRDPGLLLPEVLRYMDEQGLYLPPLETLREAVSQRVSPKRFRHILGCERLCAEMGKRFGTPEYLTRAAAILHDCTKALSREEQLTLMAKWDIIVDYDQENFDALIHADTGAETAKREFHMPDCVTEAIRTHTTGSVHMSTLQKILYVADMCEETRSYPGVETLRALALQDLDAAVTAAMEQSVSFVRSQGKALYAGTLRALEARKTAAETEEKV